MHQNLMARNQKMLPICPRPVYYRKPSTQIKLEQFQSPFHAYCEQIKLCSLAGQLEKIQYCNQQNMTVIKTQFIDMFEQRACEPKIQYQSPSSQGCSQSNDFIDMQQNKIVQQTGSYKKFLKRSTANDTKNIPKNFGKAIISFIQKNQRVIARCIKRYNISLQSFIRQLKIKKKILHSIRELRSLWMDQDFVFAKPFRQLSFYFLRRVGHRYIFGSRVADFNNHLKYRYRIMKALKCPKTFHSIKI